MYNWTITEDKLDAGQRIGLVGPRAATLSHEEIKNHPDRQHFKMHDDDGEHDYSGFIVHGGRSDGFEPLDDFGAPNAGCTEISYRQKDGSYSQL
jgi:hypothetical protein